MLEPMLLRFIIQACIIFMVSLSFLCYLPFYWIFLFKLVTYYFNAAVMLMPDFLSVLPSVSGVNFIRFFNILPSCIVSCWFFYHYDFLIVLSADYFVSVFYNLCKTMILIKPLIIYYLMVWVPITSASDLRFCFWYFWFH